MADTTLQVSRRPTVLNFRALIPQVLVGFYLLISIGVLITVPFNAVGWFKTHPKEMASAQLSLFYIPYFTGLIFLICSLWIFSIHHAQINGQAFTIFAASTAQATAINFGLNTTHQFLFLWSLAIPLTGAALIQLTLVFPIINRWVSRYPWLSWVSYLPVVPLFIITTIQISAQAHQANNFPSGWWFNAIFTILAALFFVARNIYLQSISQSPVERGEIRIILTAAFCSFLPLAGGLLSSIARPNFGFPVYLLLPLIIFPIIAGSSIQRYRLLRTDFILRRAALYGSLAVLTVGSFALIISGLSLILTHWISSNNPVIEGLVIFLIAIAINPVRDRLQGKIDKLFFRGERILQEKIQAYNRELIQTSELIPILNLLRNYIDQALSPSQLHIYIFNPVNDLYVSSTDARGQSTSDIRFAKDNCLVQLLDQRRAPLFINSTDNLPASLEKDRQRIAILDVQLFIPIPGTQHLTGWVALGARHSGEAYTLSHLRFLEALVDQSALTIEHAQVMFDMERRVREMFENARLDTLTDQALSAQVEELSVMQRIDRELNTSLDISKAMNITLDWAMRQSLANAGLVGIIEEHGIRIMASQGYSTELIPFENTPLPLELPPFQAAIQSGQLQQVDVTEDEFIRASLLNGAKRQVIIPIRREASAIGVILLESTTAEPHYEETIAFLNRLSDHAAIAISNAQLYSAVKAANAAKSEFVSFVSHELKNPITSIKGYTELIAAGAVGPVNEAQANFLSIIRSNVEQMSTLVSDLADVPRIEAGRLRLDFKLLSVYEVAEEVIRSLRRQIEEKQQLLIQEIPADLPMVWVDRTRLNQILTNLINNAVKYTPASGQIITGGEFTSNKWNQNGPLEVVHIWVRDTGIGINPDDQQKIFQKFFRSEDPKARESPGTGLGLNITKSLVELQGGQIWFESEFRKGTVFHFTIPVSE